MQAWNWLLSLQALGSQCRIFIHYLPGSLSYKVKAEFGALGATLVEIEPFGSTAAGRYCNKIRQLENPELLEADYVILSDADIAFLRDPALLIRSGRFRAKIVDAPNPPEELWSKLLVRAGLDRKVGTIPLEMEPSVQTFATNFNGGLYVMPAEMARTLLPLWRKHADFSLAQEDLLGSYLHHSDQLGIGLALAEGGMLIDSLAAGANLPMHFPREKLSLLAKQEVSGLHYHWCIDQHGLPSKVGVEWIDAAIHRLREVLTAHRRNSFLNDIFWDFRYAQFPELGSGLGSRDEILAYKQRLLHPYITMIGDGTILDVGCGDLEVFAPLPAVHYTGIDVSEQALSIARDKRPEWAFEFRSISDIETSSFDYCSCIDVFIHQPNERAAKALVHDLTRVASKGIIFSAHSVEIEGDNISFNSSDIKYYIATMPEISAVYEIGSYRDVTLYFAEKGMGERRTEHDAGLQELAIGVSCSVDADHLKELVAFSRERVGFFPRTVIRTHEYPWFVDQMRGCAGKHILDVGAGVCFLPFYLAENGAHVTTIDKHSIIRLGQPQDVWNEWGFLDYGTIDSRIKSFNADMREFDSGEKYDIIYSVSVLEHMPAEVRRDVIARMSHLLRAEGRLFLSLDLIPGDELLWNYNEGQIVDMEGHGAIGDLKAELAAAGLVVVSESNIRGMPMSRTDVAYFVCEKAASV